MTNIKTNSTLASITAIVVSILISASTFMVGASIQVSDITAHRTIAAHV